MAFVAAWGVLRYEADPTSRRPPALLASLYAPDADHSARGLRLSFFDFIVAGFDTEGTSGIGEQALADGLATLVGHPDAPYWDPLVENCDADEIAAGSCLAVDGTTILTLAGAKGWNDSIVAVDPLPIEIRPPTNFTWRSNPHDVNGGGSSLLNPGGGVYAAYWLGRRLVAGDDGLANIGPDARGRPMDPPDPTGGADTTSGEPPPDDDSGTTTSPPVGTSTTGSADTDGPAQDGGSGCGCRATPRPAPNPGLLRAAVGHPTPPVNGRGPLSEQPPLAAPVAGAGSHRAPDTAPRSTKPLESPGSQRVRCLRTGGRGEMPMDARNARIWMLAGLATAAVAGCGAVDAGDAPQPLPAPGKADAITSGLPFISECVEASFGFNKAIELYNPLPFAVSMDGCRLRVYSNGRTSPRSVSLDGTAMDPGGTLVACHASATAFDVCDVRHGWLSFNGNDAIELACDFGNGPITLDVFGVVGEDPGASGWTIGDAGTTDQTVRRQCSVGNGDDAFDPQQWEAVGRDMFDDLGVHERCDEPEPAACSLGEGVLGGPASAVLGGEDARFSVDIDQPVLAGLDARTRVLLLTGYLQFPGTSGVTDAAGAVRGIAGDGGRIETFTIRDTETGLDWDAVRFYMNDATEHAIVVRPGETEPAAFAFDGEFFACDPALCADGDLTLPFFEQLDENFEPTDRFQILENQPVLSDFARRNRVFRSSADPTLLTVAWQEHMGESLSSLDVLEQIARDPGGTLTYEFVAGPHEDYEAVVFEVDDASDHGLLVVEDALDPEALTRDGEVVFCAPPPG